MQCMIPERGAFVLCARPPIHLLDEPLYQHLLAFELEKAAAQGGASKPLTPTIRRIVPAARIGGSS